jgi:DNA invertase Pin-like site-specific DNA recombinase
MRVGYARVSRKDQRLEPQRDALLADGCERVFEEKVSSREAERGALLEAFDYCRKGDVLVVARLDRLGRSLRELIDLVGELEGRGVGFRSLKESLDTTTAGGRLIFHVFGALAEFEREIIRERTLAGLESARARGRHGGRPRALDENRAKLARRLKAEGEHSVEEICSMLGVGRSTLYRYLSEDDGKEGAAEPGSRKGSGRRGKR